MSNKDYTVRIDTIIDIDFVNNHNQWSRYNFDNEEFSIYYRVFSSEPITIDVGFGDDLQVEQGGVEYEFLACYDSRGIEVELELDELYKQDIIEEAEPDSITKVSGLPIISMCEYMRQIEAAIMVNDSYGHRPELAPFPTKEVA